MHLPSATYRVQLNKDFTFKKLLEIIDYLHMLGISTIYAAPILKSTKGSIHGYDVVDPHMIDPEIGTKAELEEIAAKLKERRMTWIQDIVPNHMAFDWSNKWLMDVLERGPASPYYNYFDVNWNHPSHALRNRLMVPFLGDDVETCVKQGDIEIMFDQNGFQLRYFDNRYPVSMEVYDYILSFSDSPSLRTLRQQWNDLTHGGTFSDDYQSWNELKSYWINSITPLKHDIEHIVSVVNGNPVIIMNLLGRQHYVLSHWKRTEKEINYRRFFTVNQLICLRMEDDNVFRDYHSFLLSLYNEGLIQGFRIDHIDGLKDPTHYVKNLRMLFGEQCYIIAEKILESKENIPADWPIQGTSGYEFLAYTNQLFTDKRGAKQLVEFYKTLVPELPPYKQLVIQNKKMILETYMVGEWENLVHYLIGLKLGGRFAFAELKEALGWVMVSLPVYRIYPKQYPLIGNDLELLKETFEKARRLASSHDALEYLYTLFVASPTIEHEEEQSHDVKLKPQQAVVESHYKMNVLTFLKRLMQFTGPITAKGVEDTTFYIYNPLISHDEVGDSPSTLGITINQFHKKMVSRWENTPLSLNATATHDTKRGEDVRLRLNVLSEMPDYWQQHVTQWKSMNESFFRHSKPITLNDEYFIYQTIVGGYPEDLNVNEEWKKRLQQYLIKVVREAKVNSNWESPNEAYETACSRFINHLLSDDQKFLPSVRTFLQEVLPIAHLYALGQVLIKITAPGVPDIYQGCELWDLSYVDPDNRRAVDFTLRRHCFEQIVHQEKTRPDELLTFLKENRSSGIEKLFVTWKALTFRRNNDELFSKGSYVPLHVTGGKKMACVYARNFENRWTLVAVPFGSGRKEREQLDFEEEEAVVMLEQLPRQWINIFTGKSLATNGYVPLKELFKDFPVALFVSQGIGYH